MQSHIDTIAYYIVKYIQDEPLFALNYKQMLLSDGNNSYKVIDAKKLESLILAVQVFWIAWKQQEP